MDWGALASAAAKAANVNVSELASQAQWVAEEYNATEYVVYALETLNVTDVGAQVRAAPSLPLQRAHLITARGDWARWLRRCAGEAHARAHSLSPPLRMPVSRDYLCRAERTP